MSKKNEKTELEKKLEQELASSAEAQEPEASPCAGEDAPAGDVLVADKLIKTAAERDELNDQLLRLRAEFDNYRKRTARDTEQIRKRAAEGLLRDLLPVSDNLERALEHADGDPGGFAEGVGMVLAQLREVLAKSGLEPIDALGEAFDPNVHEALSHLPSEEHPADAVMEEYLRGYRVGDFVLRPAQVVVSSGPPEPQEADAEPAEKAE